MFTKQELELAQRAAGMAVWEWSVERDELYWLGGGAEVFGRPTQELRTRDDVVRCIFQDDLKKVEQKKQLVILGIGDYDAEYRVLWPDGSVHWVRTIARNLESPEHGKVLVGVSQDITEAKLREEKLAAQAKLLDLAYEPILVRDAEDRITYWNKGAERLYGYSWQEAKGQRSHDLLHTKFPEPLPDINDRMRQASFWEGELVHRAKGGHWVHVASRWQSFGSEGSATLETNFDLSHQKALQIAKVWEEKSKLIAQLAHEINNPLAAARGAAHLLKTSCNEPAQPYLDILETAIQRIARFIKQADEIHYSDLEQQSKGPFSH